MSSKGEIYAGIRQNQGEMAEIQQIRGVTATLIDNLEHLGMATSHPFVKRAVALAQTKYEEACMMAVKAIYLAAEPVDPIVETAHDPAVDA